MWRTYDAAVMEDRLKELPEARPEEEVAVDPAPQNEEGQFTINTYTCLES